MDAGMSDRSALCRTTAPQNLHEHTHRKLRIKSFCSAAHTNPHRHARMCAHTNTRTNLKHPISYYHGQEQRSSTAAAESQGFLSLHSSLLFHLLYLSCPSSSPYHRLMPPFNIRLFLPLWRLRRLSLRSL